MNNEQILTRAIEKAIANEWKPKSLWLAMFRGSTQKLKNDALTYALGGIFNHDFAKALWGENKLAYLPLNQRRPLEYDNDTTPPTPKFDWQSYELVLPAWEYHLQQMVVAEDPISYLGANL